MSRLKNVQESLSSNGMGLIFRTASQTMGEEAIVSEIEGLKSRWNSIVTSVERVKAPSCLYRHSHLFERCLRDFDLDSFDAILADGQNTYNLCQKAFEEIKPGKIMPIGLYSSEIPLFDVYKVDSMLDKALARKVYLKSGGYLVIDQTEAMTVIDVNSGTYVKPTDAESEAVSINLEAAGTIARLLRLLDIGGIVVVDFIDMSSQSNRELLLGTLRESLRSDHLPTEVLGITRLGLVEMTRKSVGLSLKQRLYSECTCCQGGFVESHELIARRILHALRRKSQGCPGMAWRITSASSASSASKRHMVSLAAK